jgi:hypothetical protein
MTFQGWFDSFIWTHQSTADVMRACWQAATLAEREQCAGLCEKFYLDKSRLALPGDHYISGEMNAAETLEKLIRGKANEEE